MPLDIKKFGDPVLKTRAAPVENFDESLVRLTQDMLATMRDQEGVGLAARVAARATADLLLALNKTRHAAVSPLRLSRTGPDISTPFSRAGRR